MKTMRTAILGFLTAAVLALVLPFGTALGAEKQYFLTASPATPPASSGPFRFTFTNDGNSSFNSLTLTVPPGWSIPGTAVVTPSRGVATVNAARTEVTVNAINLPNGAGQSMTVDISAVAGTAACGSQAGLWSAQPWTGSTVGSGQTFKIKGSFPSTTIPTSCYTVTSSTSDAAKGTIAPLGTQQVNAGAQPSFTITPTAAYDIGTTGGTCGGTLTGNTFKTTAVSTDCTVVANFNIKKFAVQGSPAVNVTPTPQTIDYNQFAVFTVTPPSLSHTTSASSDTCGGSLSADKTTFATGPVTANCTVSASFAANTLTVNTPDPVYIDKGPFDVKVTQEGPAATVGISSNCGYAVTSTSTTGSTTTFTGTITKVPSTGSCTVTASAYGYPSQQKTFAVFTGTLDCYPNNWTGGTLDPGALKTYVKAEDQGKWGLVRGNNKVAGSCVAVQYIFDLDVTSSPQLASFIVPDPAVSPYQRLSAEYVVVWGRVAVDASGPASSWTTKRPKLSWGTASAPDPTSDDFVPALSCVLDPDNPDLTGTGNTYPNGFRSVPTGDLEGLLPFIPNVPPFSTSPHPQYRPFLADNVTPQRAKMCIAQQGWTAVGKDDPSGPMLIQYWTRVIDQADGFMSLDN